MVRFWFPHFLFPFIPSNSTPSSPHHAHLTPCQLHETSPKLESAPACHAWPHLTPCQLEPAQCMLIPNTSSLLQPLPTQRPHVKLTTSGPSLLPRIHRHQAHRHYLKPRVHCHCHRCLEHVATTSHLHGYQLNRHESITIKPISTTSSPWAPPRPPPRTCTHHHHGTAASNL